MNHRKIYNNLNKPASLLFGKNILNVLDAFVASRSFIVDKDQFDDQPILAEKYREFYNKVLGDAEALDTFLDAATKEAYIAFGIKERHELGKQLFFINKEISNLSKKFIETKKLEALEKIENDLLETKINLLKNLSEFQILFEHHMITKWLESITKSNAFLLRTLLKETLEEYKNHDTLEFAFYQEIQRKHGLDIMNISHIPLFQLNKRIVNTINGLLKNDGTPELFRRILEDKLNKVNLLQKHMIFANTVDKDKLRERNEEYKISFKDTARALKEEVSLQKKYLFTPLENEVDKMRNILTGVESPVIQHYRDKIREHLMEIEKLENELKRIQANIAPNNNKEPHDKTLTA